MHPRPHPATSTGILIQRNGAELETCEKTENLPCDEDRKFIFTFLYPHPLGQGLALSSGCLDGWIDGWMGEQHTPGSDEQKRLPGLHGVPAEGLGITCGSPTEGAVRLKEQGQARGQKPAGRRGGGALAPCRPKVEMGRSNVGAGAGTEPQYPHTWGGEGTDAFSCLGTSSALGKEANRLGPEQDPRRVCSPARPPSILNEGRHPEGTQSLFLKWNELMKAPRRTRPQLDRTILRLYLSVVGWPRSSFGCFRKTLCVLGTRVTHQPP